MPSEVRPYMASPALPYASAGLIKTDYATYTNAPTSAECTWTWTTVVILCWNRRVKNRLNIFPTLKEIPFIQSHPLSQICRQVNLFQTDLVFYRVSPLSAGCLVTPHLFLYIITLSRDDVPDLNFMVCRAYPPIWTTCSCTAILRIH